jgi:hypothetical protein
MPGDGGILIVIYQDLAPVKAGRVWNSAKNLHKLKSLHIITY